MAVDTVENAAIRREVERNERKYRGKRRRIELRVHIELVGRQRQHRAETLFLLEECRAYVDEAGFKDGAYFTLRLVDLFARIAIDGEIEAHVEDAFLCLLKRVAQLLEVGVRGVEHRVAHDPLLFAGSDLTLDLGHLLLELAEHFVGIHRVNEYRDVDHLIHVDDRREPAGGKEARIRDHEECACDLLSEIEFARIHFERVRRDHVLEIEYPGLVDLIGKHRKNIRYFGAFFVAKRK